MGHDVFLSYSSLDKLALDAVRHGLEAKGIRWLDRPARSGDRRTALRRADHPPPSSPPRSWCWAPLDNVNKSHAVHNEVDPAAAANVTIVPFRLSGVDFNPELQFPGLGRVHWLDALPHPVDVYIDDLAATVQRNLTARSADGAPPAPGPGPRPEPEAAAPLPEPHVAPAEAAPPAPPTPVAASTPGPASNRPLIFGLVGAGVLVLAVIVVGVLFLRPSGSTSASSSASAAATAPNPQQVQYFENVVVPRGPRHARRRDRDHDGPTSGQAAGPWPGRRRLCPGRLAWLHRPAKHSWRRMPRLEHDQRSGDPLPQQAAADRILLPRRPLRPGLCHGGRGARAGYTNVFWYRGGINAWTRRRPADRPAQPRPRPRRLARQRTAFCAWTCHSVADKVAAEAAFRC